MTIFQAVILAIIQGITEFLPISSSGHLKIVETFFHTPQILSFDIALHLGSLLALILYFRIKIISILKNMYPLFNSKGNFIVIARNNIATKIIVATIPALVIGLIFKDQLETLSDPINFIAFDFAIWGIVFVVLEKKFAHNTRTTKDLTLLQAFVIGCFECLSFLRGTSRSGITIIGGMLQKLKKEEAVEFSFLIGIPIIMAAVASQVLEISKIKESAISFDIYLIGIIVSFIVSLLTIHLLLRFISKIDLKYFGYYRIIMAVILIFYFA